MTKCGIEGKGSKSDVTPSNDEVKNNDENAVGEDEFLDKLFSSDTKDNNTANIDTLVATMHDSLFKLYAVHSK